jgi:hypothetical protein
MAKIHIISCFTKNKKHDNKEIALRGLFDKSDKLHQLVNNPDDSDLVIFIDIAGPNWFAELRNNPVILRKPGKCFAISDSDRPMPLLHGVYTCASRDLRFLDRFRTGAYNLLPAEIKNTLVASCEGRSYENSKRYLFSFAGRDSAKVRKQLFELTWPSNVFIQDTSAKYHAFGQKLKENDLWANQYFEILQESKFAVCPRGVGSASLRLFEAMQMGVAPIILADDWIFPKGPDWSEFALIVPEKDVDRLYEIAKMNEGRALEMGRKARLAYETYFADEVYFNYLVDQMVDIQRSQKIPERVFWSCRNLLVAWWKLRKKHLMTE